MAAKKAKVGRRPVPRNGVEMAIEKVGSQSELARTLGVGRQLVNHWMKMGKVPPDRALEIERRLGIHRHYLNPTVYPERPEKVA
jgi:DNA-binding transcriptional regulator YdaS (Cro superfamily)